jgi:hypothetical protein
MIGFVQWKHGSVPHVETEQQALPEHLGLHRFVVGFMLLCTMRTRQCATCGDGTATWSSGFTPVYSGIHVVPSLNFCVMFCTSLFLLWLFCIFCPSIYGFSLLFGICNRFSFSFIGSCTSIKCGGVKQALEPNSPS